MSSAKSELSTASFKTACNDLSSKKFYSRCYLIGENKK